MSKTPSSGPLSVGRPPDGSGPRIGLCLSGGGFRATFFGLGVLRYLREAQQLPRLQAVSSVSGGSVAAAVLAERWPALASEHFASDAFEAMVTEPLVEAITHKNLRNRGIGRWLITRPIPRRRFGSARGEVLVRHLLEARHLSELPQDLQVVLTSTDLSSGRAFRFSQEFVGAWQFGYTQSEEDIAVSTALGASTAVPLLFPPVHLPTDRLALSGAPPAELSLVDGGVYDNLGLEWFQGWDRGRPPAARECDFIIVVDASGPMSVARRHFGWTRSVTRSQAAQYMQSRTSRIRWFVDQLQTGAMAGLYIPISSDPSAFRPPRDAPAAPGAVEGALPVGFADELSQLRTDLDRFSAEEVELLMYHGYWAAHVRLRNLRPDLATATPGWRDFAHLDAETTDRLKSSLRTGRRRRIHRWQD